MRFANILSFKSFRQCFVEIGRNKRKTAYFVIYLIALVIGTIVIHESAHLLAALALGVPFNEIELGFNGINPGVKIPEHFASISLAVYHYAGGLTAGVILLGIYLFYWLIRYRYSPSLFIWFMGAITMTFFGIQIGQGYLEGRFHAAYIYGASSFFDSTDIVLYTLVFFAWLIHFQLFSVTKMKKREL